jgi:undecaprenyl-phosphate galactose phosphotransferase
MNKRFFDITFSIFALVLGAPIFMLCMLAVRLTSGGSLFYGCTRVGKEGQVFRCWKFRTMVEGAESMLPVLLASNSALSHEWKTFYKLKEDPRITAVGKWLRKTSLDEIPQFWNVLKGEMSIVGPRPLSQEEISSHLKGRSKKILSLRPGITGLWAISGRSEIPYDKRISLEEQYIDCHNFSLDLAIIAKTAISMFLPRGAF